MNKLFLYLLLGLTSVTYAQNRKVVPPSPEATSVFKFSEVPVSPYTGTASTNVPLYEIKLKDMTIPINLSYHGRGVKVEEMAPRVGLGWSLNYGGMLSSQIRGGRADELPTGPSPQADDIFTDANAQHILWTSILNAASPLDQAPDKFMLDMNGQSANFMLDVKYNRFLLQKYADISIVAVPGTEAENYGIVAWIITDQHGNKFYYGKNKNRDRVAIDQDVTHGTYDFIFGGTVTIHTDADNTPTRNTWHLMQIETINHESVEFFYEAESLWHYTRSSDRKDRNNSTNTSGATLYTRCWFSKIESQQYQVKKITYNGGQVTFGKSPYVRQDVFGSNGGGAAINGDPVTLDTVSVYDSKNALLKRYQLNYQYVTAASTPGYQLDYLISAEPAAAKRLFLTSVQEKGQNGEIIPPTTFEYSPVALPNRFSNSQDAWGFFNGKNNGQFLTYFNNTGINPDRNIDTSKSEAGLLRKINLPSGGSTNFTYEQNRGQTPFYIDQITTPDNTSTHEVGISLIKNPSYYTVNSDGDSCYQTPVHIGSKKVGTVTFKMTMVHCSGGSTDSYCNPNYYLIKLDGPVSKSFYRQSNLSLDLPSGDYVLSVFPTAGNFNAADPNNTFFITMDWNELDTIAGGGSSTGIRLAGGMRVKKVEYKNADGTALVKTYKYQNPDGSSSGQILGMPAYFWLIPVGETTLASTIDNPGLYPMVDDLGAVPGAPLSNVQGNGIGYSRVEEYTGDGTVNLGKTVYTYTNMEDAGDYWRFPYEYPTDNEWLRGSNLSTSYYKNTGGTYVLQKEIANTYDYANTSSSNIFWKPFLTRDSSVFIHHIDRVKWYMPLIKVYEGIGTDGVSGTKQTFIYYQTGGTSGLTSTTETDYESNGTNFTKATNYYQDYDKHYNAAGSETTNSDGTTTGTHLSYAGNYPAGTAFIDTLKARHILDVPVEQVTYKNNNGVRTVLSGSITTYKTTPYGLVDQVLKLEPLQPIVLSAFKFSDRATGVLPPDGVASTFAADSHYQPNVTFNSYDSQNNPLTLTPAQGQPVSYVWGYNQLYPVAEAKNAKENNIFHQNFEDTEGNSTDARTGNQCRTGGYSHNLSGLDNGSYILSYWIKGSGGWAYQRSVVAVSAGTYTITLSGQVDDICFYPVTSQMATYTYRLGIGMGTATDTKGMTTFYEYDGLQRLVNVKDKDGNIVKYIDYHYANQ